MVRTRAITAILVSLLLLLLVVSAAQASPGETAGRNSNEVGASGKESSVESKTESAPPAAQGYPRRPAPSYKAEDWTVAIYPILVWAPVMGGSVNMPDLPAEPGQPGGGVRQGDVTRGMSGAYFAGLAIQRKRFVADISGIWARYESSGTNPKINLDTDLLYYDASAGFKVHRDLAILGGIRHLSLKMDAKLGDRSTVTWEPSITDPIVGLEWRPSLGKHWGLDVALKGGGFGAGSDLDLSATGRLDWRFSRHFGLTMGYGAIHFKLSREINTSLGNFTRETTQTLHGPIFGFGIYF